MKKRVLFGCVCSCLVFFLASCGTTYFSSSNSRQTSNENSSSAASSSAGVNSTPSSSVSSQSSSSSDSSDASSNSLSSASDGSSSGSSTSSSSSQAEIVPLFSSSSYSYDLHVGGDMNLPLDTDGSVLSGIEVDDNALGDDAFGYADENLILKSSYLSGISTGSHNVKAYVVNGTSAANTEIIVSDSAPVLPNEVDVAEQLSWEGTPTCGWSWNGDLSVRKDKAITANAEGTGDADIVVNGTTYLTNCLGTHLPATYVDQDIVYDISSYTGNYSYFDVSVAQTQGGANNPKFTVLLDDVPVGVSFWNSATVKNPALIRAYAAGAKKLTLRLNWTNETSWFGNGQCAWINPRLYNIDAASSRIWASDLMQGFTSTATGYDSGYGNRVVLDSRADGTPFTYYSDNSVNYAKGFGLHLLNSSYAAYSVDKTNSANFISLKWNIADMNLDYFNAVVYIVKGYGSHFDIWIDGAEVQTSGYIPSIATDDYNGVWDLNAGYVINTPIPAGSQTFEIRVVADTIFNDGLTDICNPSFFKTTDYLMTRYAFSEARAPVWPTAVTRGYSYNGTQASIHDSSSNENYVVDNSLFGLVGTAYTFDIAGLGYNYFSSKVGVESYMETGEMTFAAEVTYADSSVKDFSSAVINWNNSNIDFSFGFDPTNATTLTLFETGTSACSDSVWNGARLAKKLIVTYQKYLVALSSVHIKDLANKDRQLDFLLVANDGTVDILEIKKPFASAVMSEGTYRDNFIPKRELNGAIVQCEKYLYYLTGNKAENERLIQKEQAGNLENLVLKITNPQSLILVGRSAEFNGQRAEDFEIFRRCHKNISEILTYDDLLERIRNSILFLTKVSDEQRADN